MPSWTVSSSYSFCIFIIDIWNTFCYIASMRYAVYSPKAIAYMDKLPRNQRQKISEKIDLLVENPDALTNNIIKMQGEPYYRLRVGDWRVKYLDDGLIVDIVEIMPRGKNYKP